MKAARKKILVRLPPQLVRHMRVLAKEDERSLNAWMLRALQAAVTEALQTRLPGVDSSAKH